MRGRAERFFRHLKYRASVFHNKLSARSYVRGITNLKLFLNLFTLYYQVMRGWRRMTILIRTLSFERAKSRA